MRVRKTARKSAAATWVAEPGSAVQFKPRIALIGWIGDDIALAGRIAVFAIGAGGMSAGETDCGIGSCLPC